MKEKDADVLKLIADNEQDRAGCWEWYRTASVEEKLAVWTTIQRSYDDLAMEIMSHFAQLAFAEMEERYQREQNHAEEK